MSEKYRTIEQYKCLECGRVHDHPLLAENCWYRDRMENKLEEVANHQKLARSEFDDERFKQQTKGLSRYPDNRQL